AKKVPTGLHQTPTHVPRYVSGSPVPHRESPGALAPEGPSNPGPCMGRITPPSASETESAAPLALPRRDGRVPVLVLGALAGLAALGVHGLSLYHPLLYTDDFDILRKSLTWADARANLWVPVNEHTCPLTRLSNWLLIQAAGRLTALPLAAALEV